MIIWVGEENCDDHLGRLMITWVGERFKPSLARQACVPKTEMITWVGDDHLGRREIQTFSGASGLCSRN